MGRIQYKIKRIRKDYLIQIDNITKEPQGLVCNRTQFEFTEKQMLEEES